MSSGRAPADACGMERRVIWLCAAVGGTVGSLAPALWGASEMSLSSIVLGLIGGIAGVFLGARLAGV